MPLVHCGNEKIKGREAPSAFTIANGLVRHAEFLCCATERKFSGFPEALELLADSLRRKLSH